MRAHLVNARAGGTRGSGGDSRRSASTTWIVRPLPPLFPPGPHRTAPHPHHTHTTHHTTPTPHLRLAPPTEVPLPFVVDFGQTYADIGAKRVWVRQYSSGSLEKRCVSALHIVRGCVRSVLDLIHLPV